MREAVIVAGARTPVGKAKKGSLSQMRPDDFGAVVVKETLKRAGYLGEIDDLIIGCAMPEAEQGMNVARNIGALAGLPDSTPAITINRYCSSGLQTIAYAVLLWRLCCFVKCFKGEYPQTPIWCRYKSLPDLGPNLTGDHDTSYSQLQPPHSSSTTS